LLYTAPVAESMADWYNTSAAASEVNEHGSPYGFFITPLAGLRDGYPVLMDSRLPAKRAKQMLTYLADGAYLSRLSTSQLTAQMFAYNAQLRVLAYYQAVFQWSPQGAITGRMDMMVCTQDLPMLL
jgi:hypothetical protein